MSGLPAQALAQPAAVPPQGVVPNMAHPANDGYILIIVSSILLVMMTMFVTARLYTKKVVSQKWTWDDLTCIIGALFATAYYAVTVNSVLQCNIGKHQYEITLGQLLTENFFIISYLAAILAPPALLFIKLTFFFFYMQIFRPIILLRYAIWFGGVITVLIYTGFTIAFFVLGTRRANETWFEHFEGPLQTKLASLSIPLPAVGLGLDLYILIIPMIGIWNLQLSFRRKVGVGLMFLTAIIAVIASILCITYRVHIQGVAFGYGDITWELMPVFLTSNVEMTLGVCIACMPQFSNMLRHTLPQYESLRSKLVSRFSRDSKGSSKGSSKVSSKASSKNSRKSPSDNGSIDSNDVVRKHYEADEYKTTQPVKTFITNAKSVPVSEDRVHLKHEVTQEFHPNHEYLRSMSSQDNREKAEVQTEVRPVFR